MSRIAVILTSYNRDSLLDGAIQSVLTQTFIDYTLYIMDDDSDNPKTHEVLDKYEHLDNVHIYRHKLDGVERYSRCGYGENINRALKLGTEEYITYLTCDDIFYHTRLARMIEFLDTNPDVFICYGKQMISRLHPNGNITPMHIRNSPNIVQRATSIIDHNSVMHRRRCLVDPGSGVLRDNIWPVDPGHMDGGDGVVWCAFNLNWPFILIPGNEPTDEHRLHKQSIQSL